MEGDALNLIVKPMLWERASESQGTYLGEKILNEIISPLDTKIY